MWAVNKTDSCYLSKQICILKAQPNCSLVEQNCLQCHILAELRSGDKNIWQQSRTVTQRVSVCFLPPDLLDLFYFKQNRPNKKGPKPIQLQQSRKADSSIRQNFIISCTAHSVWAGHSNPAPRQSLLNAIPTEYLSLFLWLTLTYQFWYEGRE